MNADLITESEKGGWLVVGADSTVGKALIHFLHNKNVHATGTTRRRESVSKRRFFLDISENIAAWQPPEGVSTTVLCAGVTGIEQCRKDAEGTQLVNVQRTFELAEKLILRNIFVIFLSTNQVFDGTVPHRKAEDTPCPKTEYGRQKAEAEKQLQALSDASCIVRMTKVVCRSEPLFDQWIHALTHRERIRPFTDMVFSPLSLPSIIETLYPIGKRRLPGIVQLSGETDITYADAGFYLAEKCGAPMELVHPMKAKESGIIFEHLPSHTTLDTSRTQKELGIKLPSVREALDTLLEAPL